MFAIGIAGDFVEGDFREGDASVFGVGAQAERGADLAPGVAVFAGLADVLARERAGRVFDLPDRADALYRSKMRSNV